MRCLGSFFTLRTTFSSTFSSLNYHGICYIISNLFFLNYFLKLNSTLVYIFFCRATWTIIIYKLKWFYLDLLKAFDFVNSPQGFTLPEFFCIHKLRALSSFVKMGWRLKLSFIYSSSGLDGYSIHRYHWLYISMEGRLYLKNYIHKTYFSERKI